MSGDILPLTPVSSTPLVREKRHYPGEQKDKNQTKDEPADDELLSKEESEEKSDDDTQQKVQQKSVKIDKKDGKVGHIDEYA